jgi:superfamily II DNA or RNA helicase
VSDFADIGCLIADEAHSTCSEQRSKSLLYFTPKYTIGLTATPDRDDELNKILDLHFGAYQITVPLWVPHNYYKLETKLVPETTQTKEGRLDWGSVLAYQATHPDRNWLIVRLCMFFSHRCIIVLCRRTCQVHYLHKVLCQQGVLADYIDGKKKKFNKMAQVLVTTSSKSGEGFDHPRLDMMIIASDVESLFAQYFGRCVRREDVVPIFVDLVDDMKNLKSHFNTRKEYSISVGGTIKDFKKEFPQFYKPPEIILE